MAIRGNTKNIAQSAQSGKELDPVETLVPFHIDLKNGHLTPALNWERRPGLFLQWVTESAAVPTPTPPTPPLPPPDVGECPDVPSVTHIDAGFTQIFNQTAAIDQTNVVAYYGGSTSTQFIVAFDMTAMTFLWETFTNGKRWYLPGVDSSNGAVYARDTTGGIEGIVEINPTTGAEVRASGDIGVSINTMPKVTTDRIFTMFSSPGLNQVSAINKSDLTLRWQTNTPGSSLGVGNRISGVCTDGNGDFWIHTHQSGSVPYANVLIKFDSASGASSFYDLSASFPSGTFQNISYDPLNNVIVVSGGGGVANFNLITLTIQPKWSTVSLLDTGSALNGIVDGKIWFNTATSLQEWDVATGIKIQEVLKSAISGTTLTNWTVSVMMSAINCVHLNHGASASHPIGGVDALCLPCP